MNSGNIRLTMPTRAVLREFVVQPDTELAGADISKRAGIGAGTCYPILARLQQAGWLTGRWEEIDPSMAGRPRKRFYQLTSSGQAWACSALQGSNLTSLQAAPMPSAAISPLRAYPIRRFETLDAMKDEEHAYWLDQPAHERLAESAELTASAHRLRTQNADAPRLQRTIRRIKR